MPLLVGYCFQEYPEMVRPYFTQCVCYTCHVILCVNTLISVTNIVKIEIQVETVQKDVKQDLKHWFFEREEE